jgi:hypothetical protein
VRTSAWLALVALAGACRCSRPKVEQPVELGTPVGNLPGVHVEPLAAIVPGPVLLYAEAADPAGLIARLLAHPRFVALQKTDLWRELSFTDAGAAVLTLRQRVADLARVPLGDAGLRGLFDGSAAIAIRPGAHGRYEWLIVKSVAPRLRAALELASMLQSVRASEAEVRVERYRGLPLRKLRLSENERAAYYVLRDRLVIGSDEAWVKGSLDLASGDRGAPAASLSMLATAPHHLDALFGLQTLGARSPSTGQRLRWALPFQSLEFLRAEWNGQLMLVAKGDLPAGGARLMRLVPRGAPLALALGVDVGRIAASLEPVSGPDAGLQSPADGGDDEGEDTLTAEEAALFRVLRADLAPAFGAPALFTLTGFETSPRAAVSAFALTIADEPRFESVASKVGTNLLSAKPEAADERVRCIPGADGLCGGMSHEVLVVSNRSSGVRSVLPAGDLPPPSAKTLSLLIDVDAWVAGLDRYSAARPGESADTKGAIQRGLAPFAGVGRITCDLSPEGGLHRGEVFWR